MLILKFKIVFQSKADLELILIVSNQYKFKVTYSRKVEFYFVALKKSRLYLCNSNFSLNFKQLELFWVKE